MATGRGVNWNTYNFVRVRDGETLNVVVEHKPSVFDPAGETPATMQAFRVVAELSTDVLVLVPILPKPKLLTWEETDMIDSQLRGM